MRHGLVLARASFPPVLRYCALGRAEHFRFVRYFRGVSPSHII
jgi:hypothetical protein